MLWGSASIRPEIAAAESVVMDKLVFDNLSSPLAYTFEAASSSSRQMSVQSAPSTADGELTYPEWPNGLGDPRLHARLLDTKAAPRDRREVITRFRASNRELREDESLARCRPQLRQFQQAKFPTRRCSFQVACKLAFATKQCFSCAKFDDKQLGYYCDACFDSRHPAYRLDHSWAPIKEATNQEEDWVAHVTRHHLEQDAAEVKLLLDETHAMLIDPKSTAPTPVIGRHINFENAFDRISSVQGTLRELMGHIQSELAEKPALSQEEALQRIQRMWNLRKARKQLKALVREAYASFVDQATGRTYYYNARTMAVQWSKPKALGSDDLSPPAPVIERSRETKTRSQTAFSTQEEQEQSAAKTIQGMVRSHIARRRMRRLISSVYEKIWDASALRFYYHNTKTREVKWVKPRWVSDADLLTPRSRYKSTLVIGGAADSSDSLSLSAKQRDRPMTETEAASMVQRMFRRRAGFRRLLELCRGVYERIYDPEQQTYYYHNTRTKETTWEKPLLLRGAEADVFTPRTRLKRLQSLMLDSSRSTKSQVWTEEQAAVRLQGLFRARRARRQLAKAVEQRYKRALDPETGQFYFVNVETMAVSWEPPTLVIRSNAALSEL